MDISAMIKDKIESFDKSGKIEEIVEKNVLTCLEDIIKSSFQWNGEAKKSMEEALSGKLAINLSEVKLERYEKIVAELVTKHANDTVINGLAEKVQNTFNKLVGVLDKKEWKLSEIIERYIESIDKSYNGGMDDQYGEVALFVDDSRDGFCHVFFDSEARDGNYLCKNSFALHNGKIFAAKLDEIQLSPFIMKPLYDFDAFMFSLYCNNVKVEVDVENTPTEYYREDAD